MQSFQNTVDIFCHKSIVAVHIFKKKQGLAAIEIQIEKKTGEVLPGSQAGLHHWQNQKKDSSDSMSIAQCHCSQVSKVHDSFPLLSDVPDQPE